MAAPIIKIENISKKYILGRSGQTRDEKFREVVTSTVKKAVKRILDPKKAGLKESIKEEFWAVNDVSFNVYQGDRIGVIGRNGAGKSTLLKILSRITEPTQGTIKVKGRIASLLEVGTGFHPELTGRENIFLNGAILGMTRNEIKSKFDEIVAFSEVEKFLDTPVKRYSSGMYVRLAFAVAAHLDPEILIIDEVLAVGDAHFQKKCLGKMEDVSVNGRTVIFVSHNMGAVQQLCQKVMVIQSGKKVYEGTAADGIAHYMQTSVSSNQLTSNFFQGSLKSSLNFEQIVINQKSQNENIIIAPKETIHIDVLGNCLETISDFRTTFSLFKDGIRILTLHDSDNEETALQQGSFRIEFEIPQYTLRPGDYSVAIGGYRKGSEWIWGKDLSLFTISEEWDINFDPINIGILNLPIYGKRFAQ